MNRCFAFVSKSAAARVFAVPWSSTPPLGFSSLVSQHRSASDGISEASAAQTLKNSSSTTRSSHMLPDVSVVREWIQNSRSELLQNRIALRQPLQTIAKSLSPLQQPPTFSVQSGDSASIGKASQILCSEAREFHNLAAECALVAAKATCAADIIRECTFTFKIIDKHASEWERNKEGAHAIGAAERAAVIEARDLAISAVIHALLSTSRFPDSHLLVDTPFFVFGQLLSKRWMTDALWSDVMFCVAFLRVAEKLFDLWTEALFEHYAAKDVATPSVIPSDAVHGMVTWAAQQGDVQRAAQVFQRSRQFGIQGWKDHDDIRLNILTKIGSAARHTSLDGGLKRVTVQSLTDASISRETVYKRASWGVLLDLLTCLSYTSATNVIRQAAAARKLPPSDIPFFIWAALLRKAAKLHNVAEAEALFQGIPQQLGDALRSEEKAELVEIMMRMYSSSSPTDFPSTVSVFLDHVVRHPAGQPAVTASALHFQLLSRAADSRNAAAMVFLEGCADGVSFDETVFNQLFSRNPRSSIESLSKKLPHDYESSELDADIRIPADVDAHLRREEALRYRKKPLVDSTGGS